MSNDINNEGLLTEVEDLLRSSPPHPAAFMERKNDEVLGWLGRTAAVLEKWDFIRKPTIQVYVRGAMRLRGRISKTFRLRSEPKRLRSIESIIVLGWHVMDSGPCYTRLDTIFRMKTVGALRRRQRPNYLDLRH